MEDDEFESLLDKIRKDHFLVRKHTLHFFVGGVFTAIVAVFGITAKTLFDQLETSLAAEARSRIEAARSEAILSVRAIKGLEAETRFLMSRASDKTGNAVHIDQEETPEKIVMNIKGSANLKWQKKNI